MAPDGVTMLNVKGSTTKKHELRFEIKPVVKNSETIKFLNFFITLKFLL